MAGDHQVLFRRNDAHSDRRVFCRNYPRALDVITRGVKYDAQRAQSCADLGTGGDVVLSDAAGEDQHVQPT